MKDNYIGGEQLLYIKRRLIVCTALIVNFLTLSIASADILSFEALVGTSDNIPDTSDPFNYIYNIDFTNSGQFFFTAGESISSFNSSAGQSGGVFSVSEPGLIETIARLGVAPFTFSKEIPLNNFAANNSGEVAFEVWDSGFGVYKDSPITVPEVLTFLKNEGSSDLPSGVTGASHTGWFIVTGSTAVLDISDNGQAFFRGFFGGVDPIFTLESIFSGTATGNLRNIAFELDPAPGLPGNLFDSFFALQAEEDGTSYFTASVTDATFNNDVGVWRDQNGSQTLIYREGDPVPNMDGFTFVDNPNLITGPGNLVILHNNATGIAPGSNFDGLWLGNDASDLSLLVRTTNSNFDNLTITDRGNVAFTVLETVMFSENGTIYFTGQGNLMGQVIAGIWKRDSVTSDISLFREESDDVHSFLLLDTNSKGEIVYSAVLRLFSTEDAVIFADANGVATQIVKTGDTVAEPAFSGETIGSFADVQLNDNSQVGLIIHFRSFFGGEVEGVFRVSISDGPSVQEFIWSGACGDANWHNTCSDSNWNNEADRFPAEKSPGDEMGTENVTIPGFDVVISDRAVNVDTLSANGSLTVNQKLNLQGNSAVENLTLDAGLTTNGSLNLSGVENQWKSGAINGAGQISVGTDAVLRVFKPAAGKAATRIDVSLTNAGRTIQEEDATIEIGGSAKIINDGFWQMRKGSSISSASMSTAFENRGNLGILADSSFARIETPFMALDSSTISISSGSRLELTGGGTYQGSVVITLENESAASPTKLVLDGSHEFSGNIRFELGQSSSDTVMVEVKESLLVSSGSVTVARLPGAGSGSFLEAEAGLTAEDGQIILENTGLVWSGGDIKGGTFTGDILTNGVKLATGSRLDVSKAGVGPVGTLLNGAIANTGTFNVFDSFTMAGNSIVESHDGGELHISEDTSILAAAGHTALLIFKGNNAETDILRKTGAADSEIQVPLSVMSGKISAKSGKLTLSAGGNYSGSGTLEATQAGSLNLSGTHAFNGDYTIAGVDGGKVELTSGELRIDLQTIKSKFGSNDRLDFASNLLILDGGTIAGSGTFDNQGNMKWISGTISITDFLNTGSANKVGFFGNDIRLEITGSGNKVLEGTITNDGSIVQDVDLRLQGGTIKNGTDQAFFTEYRISADILGDTTSRFMNQKELFVLAGADVTIGVPLNVVTTIGEEIVVGKGATLRLHADSTSQTTLGDPEPFLKDSVLNGGSINVADGAELIVGDGGEQINVISGTVTIEGSGKLHGITEVNGDLGFKSGFLDFSDVKSASISGNLIFGGDKDFFGGHIDLLSSNLVVGNKVLVAATRPDNKVLSIDSTSLLQVGSEFQQISGVTSVDGVLIAPRLSLDGGTFGGNGTVITSNFVGAANVAPGASPGTLTIDGDYTQTATGSLLIEIGGNTPGTEYDQLVVTGSATFEEGASIDITILDLDGDGQLFAPQTGDIFDFLVADDLVLPAGTEFGDLITFTNLPNGLRFDPQLVTLNGLSMLQLFAIFGIDNTFLSGLPVPLVATGTYLNSVLELDTTNSTTLDALSIIAALSESDIPDALSQLHPEPYSGAVGMTLAQVNALTFAFSERIDRLPSEDTRQQWTMWGDIMGHTDNVDGNMGLGTSNINTDMGGLLFGMDMRLTDRTVVGALIGGADASQGFDSLRATNHLNDSVFTGLYGGYYLDRLRLAALLSYGTSQVNTRREIQAGDINGQASSEYDISQWTAHSEASYVLWQDNGYLVEPQLGLSYVDVKRDMAVEQGVDGLNLQVNAEDTDALYGDFGVRLAGQNVLASGVVLAPEISVGWRYDFIDGGRQASARFVDNGIETFTIVGSKPGRSSTRVNAGLSANLKNDIKLHARYTGQFNSDYSGHSASVGLEWRF